ncbi:unnamed protein product [Calicophoron daubneyi]|uniref:Tetraspanin n=1 Tax=Calicophoron daubneyi TaxID=300641 RepID=A0AAV2T299_CALDB
MACCFVASKLILFILNFLFVLIGLLAIGFGSWVVADVENLWSTIENLGRTESVIMRLYSPSDLTTVSGAVLIGIGIFLFILAFFGCWGVVSEHRGYLITYASVLGFLFLIEIICAILVVTLMPQWKPVVRSQVLSYFNQNYKGSFGTANEDEYSQAMDVLMVRYNCCGVNGEDDFTAQNTSWYKNGRAVTVDGNSFNASFPLSCCVFKDKAFLDRKKYSDFAKYMQDKTCSQDPSVTHNSNSCFEQVNSQMLNYQIPLVVTPVIAVFLQLVAIGLAGYLAHVIKKWDDELYF